MRRGQLTGRGGNRRGEPISNDTSEKLVGPLPDDVLTGLSIKQRYWMIDPVTGEHLDSTSGMAFKAAQAALDAAGLEPEQVDLMILATGTPDFTLPPAVNLVQEKLGLERCSTLEIRSGGAGTAHALDIARMYIEQGRNETALVIGSEVISPAIAPVFLETDPQKIRFREPLPLYMFGHPAGAIALHAAASDQGLRPGANQGIGGLRKPGIHAIGGGTHAPLLTQPRSKRPGDPRLDRVGSGQCTPVTAAAGLDAP